MLHDSPLGENFFVSLTDLDARIAQQVAAGGCRWCGGPLHQANYERKPRGGGLAVAGEAFTLRHSLCCGREGCRKRALPPSLRFLGRRVYLEAVVLLASVAAQLVSAHRDARAITGVPGRTLRRWGSWWRSTFPQGPVWTELRARFMPPPPDDTDLPRSLMARLHDELEQEMAAVPPALSDVCLLAAHCLAAATTQSVPDGSRFVRAIGGCLTLA